MQRTRTHDRSQNRFYHLILRSRRQAPAAARNSDQEMLIATPNPHRKLTRFTRPGGVKGALLLWILGVPIPLILLFLLIKGCVT